MNKKNEKRLCWNCDGEVSLHLSHCIYCGVDLNQAKPKEENLSFNTLGNPFQSSPQNPAMVPKPPYSGAFSQDFTVSEEEWKQSLEEEKESSQDENPSRATKKEIVALLLLLPGIVFSLFGLALLLFSRDGYLTLQWNQNLAYFYFLGAAPLVYLGWQAFR